MRSTRVILMFAAVVALGACGSEDGTAPPAAELEAEVIDLAPDYEFPSAAGFDASGPGGALFPDSLKLSAEQKAAIQALEDAFKKANAADIAALRAIEAEARAALAAGKSRTELEEILKRALPIRARLDARFAALRAAIHAIYTPAQKAWLEANRPRECGPSGGPRLTEAQLAEIRALRDAFEVSFRAERDSLNAIVAEARAARAAGKSTEEIRAILARAEPVMARIEAAQKKLHEDIMAVLTPAQRERWCLHRGMRAPGGMVNMNG